jgi:hypothetical protein
MHIDTREYQMIRGELAGLGAAVEELGQRQRQDRRDVADQISRARGAIAELGEICCVAIDAMTGTCPRPVGREPRLAKVINFPGGGR